MNSLKLGRTRSCGCIRGSKATTHGMSRSRSYSSWRAMIYRCTNPKNIGFERYGGRGVTYDPRWEDFEEFYKDMGERPAGTELDKDIKGGIGCKYYCKENCSWATPVENQRVRRGTVLKVEKVREARDRYRDGESVASIACSMGIHRGTLSNAIHRRTWKNIV